MNLTTSNLNFRTIEAEREERRKKEADARAIGMVLHSENCPKCGNAMYQLRAPCFVKKYGFKWAARCLKCRHIMGIRK
jgi:hypothetical protein